MLSRKVKFCEVVPHDRPFQEKNLDLNLWRDSESGFDYAKISSSMLAGLVNCLMDPIIIQNGAGHLWNSWNTSHSVTRTHRNSYWIVCQVKKTWEVHRSVIWSKYGKHGFTLKLTAAILDDCPRYGCAYIPRRVLGTFCEKIVKKWRHMFFAISFWKVEDYRKFS
jgi:hypothetical protein